jgi:hypothetical protein
MEMITLDNYEEFLLDHMEGNLDAESTMALRAFVISHPELEIDLDDMDLPSMAEDFIAFENKDSLKKTNSEFTAESIVDYLENNLPLQERELFERDLIINKDLQSEVSAYKKTISVADTSITFGDKTELYKTEDHLLLKDQALLYFEGQLSLQERVAFEKELKNNAALQNELAVYAKTKLQADPSILYPHKDELKKEAKVIALFSFRNIASMAAAILLLVGFFVVFNYYNDPAVTSNKQFAKNTPTQTSIDSIVKPNPGTELQFLESEPQHTQLASVNSKTKNSPTTNDSSNKIFEKNVAIEKEENKATVIKEEIQKVEEKINEQKLVAIEQKTEKPETETNDNLVANAEAQEKYTVLAYADDHEETSPEKKGFWNKAVRLAKQANNLGLKSVDGNETERRKFSLSFNSFSVEKH